MEKNKIRYFIEGGLFLGIKRNNNLIKHDHDFEIGLFYDQVNTKILSLIKIFSFNGFLLRYVNADKETMKINMTYKKSYKISLIPYYLDGNYYKRYMWKIPSYILEKKQKINFLY